MRVHQREKEVKHKIKSLSKRFVKVLVAVWFSILFAFMLTFFVDGVILGIFRTCRATMPSSNETVVDKSRITTNDWIIDGKVWMVKKDSNPEFEIKELNTHVDYVLIELSTANNWLLGANLFWKDTGDIDYDPELRMTSTFSYEGSPYILFGVGQNVENIKIILGKRKGQAIGIERIIINPNLREYRWDFYRKAILYRLETSRYFEKFKVLFVLFLFLFVSTVVGWEKAFKRRWLIGGLLLFFLVSNRYNGDSLAIYDSYVQGGVGNEYTYPVIGEARHVRSDEWGNVSPGYISARYLDSIFEKNNYIIRGTDSLNEYAVTWYSIYNPFNLIASFMSTFMDYDYAYSFKWFSVLTFTFLINIDFFMMLTRGKRVLSVAASCMIFFSSFYQWWWFPAFVTAVPTIFVCINGFLKSTSFCKKLVWSIGISLSMAYFALNLYPAWQIPSGYLMIPVLIFILFEKWNTIKNYKWMDWMFVIGAVALFVLIIIGYVRDRAEYMVAMKNTVYPGHRFSTGGFALQKIFNYFAAALFSFKQIDNPSAESICISLFPASLIIALVYQIKHRFNNVLINALLVYSGILLTYITVGFSDMLARVTLMSYVTPGRAVEVFAYSEVLLFASVFSVISENDKIKCVPAFVFSLLFGLMGYMLVQIHLENYMDNSHGILVVIFFTLVLWIAISRLGHRFVEISYLLLIGFSLLTGLFVRPVAKGSDSIYSKPLYSAVREIMTKEPSAKWISCGTAMEAFIVASGAPCINFCNTYPNFKLWEKIDESGKYYDCYNRFAYVGIDFTDEITSMSNPQVDVLSVNISYKDIYKMDVDYIASSKALDVDNKYVRFDEIYDEDGAYIYSINYK